MKKRIFPALLSLVLLLSLVPTAFADFPMTLVQQTTGDVNKEFVYYINTKDIAIDTNSVSNVKIITRLDDDCNCGKIFWGLDPNVTYKWQYHKSSLGDNCRNNWMQYTNTYYEIRLKDGDKIPIEVKNVQAKDIYTIREANYTLSYLLGEQDISVSQDEHNRPAVSLLPLVHFTFTPTKDGTFTLPLTDGTFILKRTAFSAPAVTARPTNDALWVNGELRNATVYKINGNNYFKIRDLAAILNGTSKQFSVDYNNATKSVIAASGIPYEPVGGELSGAASGSENAIVSYDIIIVNGKTAQNVTVYKIAGNNYFKLRDLGDALGFEVDYAPGQGVFINTGD